MAVALCTKVTARDVCDGHCSVIAGMPDWRPSLCDIGHPNTCASAIVGVCFAHEETRLKDQQSQFFCLDSKMIVLTSLNVVTFIYLVMPCLARPTRITYETEQNSDLPDANLLSKSNTHELASQILTPAEWLRFANLEVNQQLKPQGREKYFLCHGWCQVSTCEYEEEKISDESEFNAFLNKELDEAADSQRIQRNSNRCKTEFAEQYVDCQGPCINQLPNTEPVCSPEKKRVRILGEGGSNVAASSNVPTRQDNDGQESTGSGTGSKTKTDTQDQDSDSEKECYFKHERQNPDGLEKKERPLLSKVSTECCGELQSFDDLAKTERVEDYGAVNNADLALVRGAAEYNNDFDDEAVKLRMKTIYICEKHANELVYNWKECENQKHILRKHTPGGLKAACSIPNNLLQKHRSDSIKTAAQTGYNLRKDIALAFLRETGAHLHVGLPMCKSHADHIKRWFVEQTVHDDGLHLVPNQENYAAAAPIDHTISDYSELSRCSIGSTFDHYSRQSQGYVPHPRERDQGEVMQLDESITEEMKTAFVEFGKTLGLDRLLPTTPFNEYQIDTQRKKGDACRRMRRTIYKIIAPGYEEMLKDLDLKRESDAVWSTRSFGKLKSILELISERYEEAEQWSDKRALLALVVPIVSFAELSTYVKGLTHFRFSAARKYAAGIREILPERGSGIKTRYSARNVDEFIGFITSDAVMIGLPYGSATAKKSSGERVELDNTLRLQRNEHVTQLYAKYLEGIDRLDLAISRSSQWEILNACSASKKKAIQGLDDFIANGRDAFDTVRQMLENMRQSNNEEGQFVKRAIKHLQESRQYLESDFKLHVKSVSRVADHCIRWALSDKDDENFATPCDEGDDAHVHDMICDRCEQLKATLSEIREHIVGCKEVPQSEKDRFDAKYYAAEKAIMKMRRHQLRSVLSGNVRTNFIEHLREDEAFVTLDWAMKLQPKKARESQNDYFGKKGLSWHISHALSRAPGNPDEGLRQRTFVHFFEHDIQNSDAVVAILRHVLSELKKLNIKKVVLRSDNAGCYHSNKVVGSIIKLSQETGVAVTHYSFSEPQAGKSSCDRMAAVVKRKINDYVDQGHDVTNGIEFISALKSAVQLNGLAFYWASVHVPAAGAKKQPVIPKVSFFYEYAFGNGILHARKFWGIGNGINIEERNWRGKESSAFLKIYDRCESVSVAWSYIHCTRLIVDRVGENEECDAQAPEEPQQVYDESTLEGNDNVAIEEPPQTYFDCPEPNCIAQFLKVGNLYRHIIQGKHKLKPERQTMRDYALDGFIDNIASMKRMRLQEPIEDIAKDLRQSDAEPRQKMEQGWAMKLPRLSIHFSDKQKGYLDEKFALGVRNRKDKVDANAVESQMRDEFEPGSNTKRLFDVNEVLTAKQIANYFSTKARRIREQNPACFDSPDSVECREISGEQITSEGDEEDGTEDPMFYSVQDELKELIEKEDIIEPEVAVAHGQKHRHRNRHQRHRE